MRDPKEQIYLEAERLVESRAFLEAEKDLKAALYGMWENSSDREEQWELNAMAKSSAMFFRIMRRWAKEGKSISDGLREEWEERSAESIT